MKTKRIVSVLMSLVLVLAVFTPEMVRAESSTIPEGMMYLDEFSGTALSSDWICSRSGTVSNGTINSTPGSFNAYLSGKDGASTWTDYSVEADITLQATASNKAVAGVALRSGGTKTWYGGYYMKLSYDNGKVTVLLYSGNSLQTGGTHKQLGNTFVLVQSGEEIGKTYHLKLTAKGEELVGYVNGTKVITYTASDENLSAISATKNSAGYPGVMVNSGTVAIDNFVVTASDVLYADTFGVELTNDWTYSGNAEVTDGTLNSVSEAELKTFYAWLNKEEGATSWTDYSVEADVKITHTKSDKATVGIALRSTPTEPKWSGGYMMKLFYDAGKVTVELYSGDGTTNTKIGTAETVTESGATIEQAYHMKMTVVGDSLLGYINGEIVIERDLESITATKHTAGYPGVMVNTGLATFDNFVVTQIPDNSIVIGEVDDNATVYVDGKESAEAKTAGIVQANPGQSVQIISDTQNTVYLVKAGGSVVQPECLQNAINCVGTSIRATGNTGIRFKSSIAKTAKAGDEDFSLQEYGTVVTKDTILNGDDLYLGATYATVKGVAYEKDSKDLIFDETDTLVQFTGVLINITESNYDTTYVGRPYAIYKDTSGSQYKIYGKMMGGSLFEVAQLALADSEGDYNDSQKAYFQKIVDAVTGGETE